ncbi:SRPBCC family protein [Rhizobacter sp. Root404]|uniref:SRPBCC family protein n=1 Tax=Rhizobacter sp. Root404 TaxID=1736528 RepID=UPI0006F5E85D|nr:SRPBCC family protein [Rhizobacter sp. Root404]KQW35271.1 polyketide cyclase [Rhizobacter sp. Root404]
MIKALALAVVALVAGVLIFATTKPDTFSVQRSATIKAPPEKIFAVLNDFHRWTEWSPWEKLDPAMKRTLGGAPAGKGATYAWEGNGKAGAGRMEIVESAPASRVGIQLDFIKPFEGHNLTVFMLTPQGDATQVNWSMTGPTPFVSKLMQVFVDMDKMIGKDFEEGLANLKALTEK